MTALTRPDVRLWRTWAEAMAEHHPESLHVNGAGYTAGCVSIPRSSLIAVLKWLNPTSKPHIAIGNSASITKF